MTAKTLFRIMVASRYLAATGDIRTYRAILPKKWKVYYFPSEWMSRIKREAMRVLVDNLTFCKTVNRYYETNFAAKIGSTLTIRRPPRFVGRFGAV